MNGHLPLISSVNVDDSPLQGSRANSYELGWRYTGDTPAHPAGGVLLDLR
ncbi:hypothetical protein LNP74_24375 [Klebsiella pneumoniae subsp. pneumoniae]|nr:hypothetical protein [Klebsiella pneumoniae subsp. pneumoniae]